MNSPNITKEEMFVGQVPIKVVGDMLKCIKILGFDISYYSYDVNSDEYEDSVTIPVFIQEDNTVEEGLLRLDRELLFVFSTSSFVDKSVVPKNGDKIIFSSNTYKLNNRIYRNAFSYVTNLLEDSILVLFTGFKRGKLKRSQIR